MKKSYIMPLMAAALLAAGCSKEEPWQSDGSDGQILKSALAVSLKSDQTLVSRAVEEVNLNDFNIIFTREGQTVPAAKYKLSEMPDVVTLPAGTYKCSASFGENRNAEWDSPHYLGESETFEVNAYEITSYIDPIECRLENIKVTVDFDPVLRSQMSDDSHVEVKVGSSDALSYGTEEADAEKAGYFRHTGESTLVATFHGKVNGSDAHETKSLRAVSKGNHYKITFRLHNGDGDPTGDGDGDVVVDAGVTVTDVERNVPAPEEPLLPDDERPNEGGETPPVPNDKAPEITGKAPLDIDAVNDGASLTECVVLIKSFAEGGIKEFTCTIDSEKLTPEELGTMGLAAELDLVNEQSYWGVLDNLGLATNVAGRTEVDFNLSDFMGLLGGLGSCEHHFILRVTDANGTTEKTLKIKF